MIFLGRSALLSVWLLLTSSFYLTTLGQYQITLLNHSTKIEVSNNELHTLVDLTYKIENKRSSWIADFELPYQNDKRFRIISAEIITSQGKVVRSLKNKDILTLHDQSRDIFYQNKLIKKFSLQWHEFPYRIRVKYESRTRDFYYVSRWSPYEYSQIPVLQANLEVKIPFDYKVNMSSPVNHQYDSLCTENIVTMKWHFENLPFHEAEKFAPPVSDYLPWITIVPHQFRFGTKGKLDSWQSYGKWQYDLHQDLLELTTSEMLTVDELIDGIDQKREKVRLLYYYLQDNTRYINVSIDDGGLIPYPASYVCDNKYGDCKALTIYMMALLKYAGIESFSADVYAGDQARAIDRSLPAQQFNHVILAVPIDGDTIWLENTSKVLPFNYLGSFTQDRPALLIKENTSEIINLPSSSSNTKIVNSQFILNKDGKSEVKSMITFCGDASSNIKYAATGLPKAEQRKYVERLINVDNGLVTNFSFSQNDRDRPIMALQFRAELVNAYREIADRLVISPQAPDLAKFETPEKRDYKVVIPTLIERHDTLRYDLGFLGGQLKVNPTKLQSSSSFGDYSISLSQKEDGVILIRHFRLNKQIIEVEEYPKFYDFIEQLNEAYTNNLILKNT